ncbi:MAG TPA: biotin/lipoyl-containing protein [Anaerolineales bacterium]|nr:biotin/lipoyl-containing protein [Anaerolineales bacterium]
MKYVTSIDGHEYMVDVLDERHVSIDGVTYDVDFMQVGDQPVYSLVVNGESVEAHVYPNEDVWQVLFHGTLFTARVEDEREKRLRASLAGRVAEHEDFHLRAPMPGMVVSIPVQDGQLVKKGDVLVILESMKMQNELRSPRDGKVTRVRVKGGDRVEQKDTMLSVV